jgi:uncharacterized OB-fold protein
MAVSDEQVWEAFAGAMIDRDNFEHHRGLLERRLLINRCQACGYWIYPHRPLCPSCWSWDVVPTEVSGEGTVYMFTLLHLDRGPAAVLETPTPLAAVELAEQAGLRYLATVVNCAGGDIKHDMAVRLVWIDRDGVPAPAFEPAL